MSAPENTPPTGRLVGLPCPGEVLAGKYQVEAVLGVGGMAVVVAARHLELDERVALKILLPKYRNNEELVTRFRREARAAVKIKSQHVARVHDVGTLEDGAPCLVMEFLEGLDLEARIDDQGPLPVEEAVDYMLQACDALAEAHGLGIVHRDLKPANLFLTKSGDGKPIIKLLDFGISKVKGWGLTKKQASFGTPHYMSPEQLHSSDQVDARTDIWSIGTILHELIAGRPAFPGNDLTELQEQVRNGAPTRLRVDAAHAPEGVEHIVLKCLAKNPDERFKDVAQLATELAPFGSWGAVAFAERVRRVLDAALERSLTMTDPGLSAMQLQQPPTPIAFMPLPASMVAVRVATNTSSLTTTAVAEEAGPAPEPLTTTTGEAITTGSSSSTTATPSSATVPVGAEALRMATKTSVAIDRDDSTPKDGSAGLILGAFVGGALALAALYGVFTAAHLGRDRTTAIAAAPLASTATLATVADSGFVGTEGHRTDAGASEVVTGAPVLALPDPNTTPALPSNSATTAVSHVAGRGGATTHGATPSAHAPPSRRPQVPTEKVFDDRK